MDIRGLILIDTPNAADGLAFARTPVALLDIAGRTPLERMRGRLREHGVWQITVVEQNSADRQRPQFSDGMSWQSAASDRFWRVAENAFNHLAENGAECVLVIRLGAYAEIDFSGFVQFHLQGQGRVSRATQGAEPLDVFCLSASRRNDAASLLRSRLTRCRSECNSYMHGGYVNPLASARDLRQFGIDVLTLNTQTEPAGREAKPGIWLAPGASVEKGSRILAPAFIGSSARIRCGAVITRCTVIEHHANVDCGTVVENSSVLPYSYVGAGLDVAHSVVGMGHIANLRRSVTVKVEDQKLVGEVAAARGHKFLAAATALRRRIWRKVFGRTRQQPALPEALRPSPVLGVAACDADAAREFASNRTIATRRYGNQ